MRRHVHRIMRAQAQNFSIELMDGSLLNSAVLGSRSFVRCESSVSKMILMRP